MCSRVVVELDSTDFSPPRASSIFALPPPRERQNAIDGFRFVAGENLYNQEMFGSLRKGGDVTFVSKECSGLAVAVAMSAFAYATLTGVIVPLMTRQLVLTHQESLAMRRLVELPMALSFFFGVLSDSHPVVGLRRKSYTVIGSLVHAASAIMIAAVSNRFGDVAETVNRPSDASIVVIVILCAFASVGCIMTFLSVHTQVIEFSQREPLKKRGVFQASYLILRRLATLGASLFTFATVRSADGDPRIHSTITILLLAFVSILPLPVVWKFWREEMTPLAFNANLDIRIKGQWRILQQRAVWSILVFICAFTLFLGVKFTDSMEIIKNWAGASADNYLLIKSIQDLVALATIVAWRHWFMNRQWRMFFCFGPVFTIVPSLFVSISVALDVVRDHTFYRLFTSLGFVADGVVALMNIVPLTEIIPEGSEASTVGIVLSFERLISTFDSTNNSGLFQGAHFVDLDQVPLDTAHVRSSVLLSLVFNYGINACALMGLVLLPNQKLDAQQLRIYGGFTKVAASSVAGFGLLLFGYSVAINIMSFVPSLSCYKLVGGVGCT